MRFRDILPICCVLSTLPLAPAVFAQANSPAATDSAALLKQLHDFHFGGSSAVSDALDQWANSVRFNPVQRKEAAHALGEFLTSDAPFDAKQLACRALNLIAGEEQVPALVGLLTDEQLGHYALMVLQHIPSKTVDDSLLRTLPTAHGRIRLEIDDTLGERRAMSAIPALSAELDATDPGVPEAAAAALGKIGDSRCLPALEAAFQRFPADRRFAFGTAVLACADRILAAGDPKTARAAYELIDHSALSSPILRAGSLRGLVQVEGDAAVPLLTAALAEDGTQRQAIAAALAREISNAAIARLAADLPKLSSGGQILLIAALSDRSDRAAAPAIMGLANSAQPAVRLAALQALASLGDAASVPLLLQVAAVGQPEDRSAARNSLIALRDAGVNEKLLQAVDQDPAAYRIEAITALGQRHATAAVPKLVSAAKSTQPAIRDAALHVLRDMGQPGELPTLLDLLLQSPAGDRDAVIDTVAEIARRGTSENERTGVLVQRYSTATLPADRVDLLSILSQVGGPQVLAILRKAETDPDTGVQLESLRQLAEWPTAEPMEDLLHVVRTSTDPKQKTLALRGYTRMIGMDSQRTPVETLALYRQTAALLQSPEEKKVLLSGLANLTSIEALDYASTFQADPAVREEAESAVVTIGKSTLGAWRDRTKAALQPIAQNSADEDTRNRAKAVLALVDKFGDFVTAWEVSPAYQKDNTQYNQLFDMPFPPEQPGHEKEVGWKPMPVGTNADQPWLLDLLALWGGEQKVAYLRTSVWSDTARDLFMELGSDDGVKAWWNGEIVVADNTARAVVPGQEKKTVSAKAGWNNLLLKITQNNQGWGACARFTNPDGAPAAGLRYALPSAAK